MADATPEPPPAAEEATLEALRQQIHWVRQALGVEADIPRLTYAAGEISADSFGVMTVPLSAGRTTAQLVMDPTAAKLLADRIYAVLASRQREAASRVLEGHVPQPDRKDESTSYCAHDGEVWPCVTAVALGMESGEAAES